MKIGALMKTVSSIFFRPKNQWADSAKCLTVRSQSEKSKTSIGKMVVARLFLAPLTINRNGGLSW